MSSTQTIVVGVDGSPGSRTALEYALDEADARGATVRVVSVFESLGMFGARYGLPIPVSDAQMAARVTRQTRVLVDQVLAGRASWRDVDVTVHAAGSPGRVLVEEAKDADLLVVGHHGRGAFAGALVGSVGMYCVLHARCPVTVVRPAAARAPEPTMAGAGTGRWASPR